MVKKILMALGCIILLAGGGAGGYYVQEYRASLEAGKDGEEKEPKFELPEPIPEEYPAAILSLEPFLANVNDPRGDRFAKVKVQLAIVPEERVPELEEAPLVVAKLRDRILTLISAKSFDELNTADGKRKLRKEIADDVNQVLYTKGCAAKEVLFAEFVVQ
jgi:flagellar FliL protein